MKVISTLKEEDVIRRKSNTFSCKNPGAAAPSYLMAQYMSLFDRFCGCICLNYAPERLKANTGVTSWLKKNLPDSFGIISTCNSICMKDENASTSAQLRRTDYGPYSYSGCVMADLERYILIYSDGNDVCICYDYADDAVHQEMTNTLQKLSDECFEPCQKMHHLQYITHEYGSFDLSPMSINKDAEISIDKQYNDDFKAIDEHINSFIDSKQSGLVILHGEQGTGKTSYIRHLINTHESTFVYLPIDMAAQLTRPDFFGFLRDSLTDAVIILEDCEQLLEDRSQSLSNLNSGLSNILNMADGLLGDSLNLRFICTFNSDVRNIDKALLRKGRLIEKYEFKKLSADKTAALLTELYGHADEHQKPLTLAEIYNHETDNHGTQESKKVGF